MTHTITLNSHDEQTLLLGREDRNLKRIRQHFDVQIAVENNQLMVEGETGATEVAGMFEDLLKRRASDFTFDAAQAESWVDAFCDGFRGSPDDTLALRVIRDNRSVFPKTSGQRKYVKAMMNNDVVFGIGPAGTGKSFLAVAAAVHYLRAGAVRRIVLVRPAVEAGEKLGFLPGTLREKIDPYLRPIYDSLFDMIDRDKAMAFMDEDVIEVAPLAYMRGRTLDKAFVILDEAQNTTREQMKMLLTRLGEGAKCAVTGDITQIDLPDANQSGLLHAKRVLNKVEGVSLVQLEGKDVVRSALVERIIRAYDKAESQLAPEREDHRDFSRYPNQSTQSRHHGKKR